MSLLNNNETMIFKCKKRIKVFILFLLISHNVSPQLPAQTIPDFTFFRLDKTAFANKNLEQGKQLFFIFFDPTCEHCQRAIQSLNDHYKQLKNTSIYLISTANAETIDQFINKYGKTLYNRKNVMLLQDRGDVFLAKFQPRRYPGMYLYSAERKLIDYEDNEESMFRFWKVVGDKKI